MFTHPTKTRFIIENPTYFLAIRVLEDHGISRDSTIKIPVDQDGLRVDVLEETLHSEEEPVLPPSVCGEKRFKYLLFLVPSFSNPTGISLSLERRKRLVELARKHDILVVCDDVYHLLHLGTSTADADADPPQGTSCRPPPRVVSFDLLDDSFGNVISNQASCAALSLLALLVKSLNTDATSAAVLSLLALLVQSTNSDANRRYVAQSFSKILGPGLRLGWVEAGRGIINQFLKSGLLYSGGSPSHFTSGIVGSALSTGVLKKHLLLLPYSRYLLYWYTGTNTDANGALDRCAHETPAPAALSLLLCTPFTTMCVCPLALSTGVLKKHLLPLFYTLSLLLYPPFTTVYSLSTGVLKKHLLRLRDTFRTRMLFMCTLLQQLMVRICVYVYRNS
jgi:DNA-binding transcriptional MocR family regulator